MKKHLGVINVDSGQLIIGDPCYLGRWKDNDFKYKSGVRNKNTGDEVIYRKDVYGWDLPIERLGGVTMNDLKQDKDWETFCDYPDKGEYSYSGACGMTCANGHGIIGDAMAFAVRTLHGDGGYSVDGVLDARGRVKRIVIEFDEPEYLLFGIDAVELYGNGVGACTIRDDGHEYMVLPSDCDWRELMGARDRFESWCEISESDYVSMKEASL
jgi:hypothetical protein